jgi:hypothetical protein
MIRAWRSSLLSLFQAFILLIHQALAAHTVVLTASMLLLVAHTLSLSVHAIPARNMHAVSIHSSHHAMCSILTEHSYRALHHLVAELRSEWCAHESHKDSARYAIGALQDSATLADRRADSLFIAEVQNRKGSDKVLHAEPLFIDLIRDLGARQGEAEWNVGFGLTDRNNFDKYSLLVEYEWAPIDRLGLEVEVPMTFYSASSNGNGRTPDSVPSNRVESLKFAAQYSFFVSEEIATSMAVGYINELELVDLNKLGRAPLFKGNLYNPFFIAAKRWGNNFHTLLYTGARIDQNFGEHVLKTAWEINGNIHYMISGTRNFVGLEVNKLVHDGTFDVVLRPQMRLSIDDHVMLGIVAGIPINRINERLGLFLRLIYEPPH